MNVVPIYEGESKGEPTDYRTVSVIIAEAKLFEAMIKERWVKYLDERNVFTEDQLDSEEENPIS